ncbi:MAG: ThiF family adenylyltransferase [Candidatus Omnitrophica bacterium]|nr:ThiF family adenylyltransferase [Candidatus Omnitrophota bacterium]MDD5690479.1 ThiF family adenylyltransferase [Candidatus Omnitrophota bacterium]
MDFPLPSKIVNANDLVIPRARDIAFSMQSGVLAYVKLLECRSLNAGFESIIFDVEVELGQKNNVYAIEKIEKIAIIFDPRDSSVPLVISLRNNFPKAPHTTLGDEHFPASLCLYDQPFSEIKIYLTPTRLIERIRQWLADTARGKLHGEDQPLEPLFLEANKQLIIPFDLFDCFNPDNPPKLEVYITEFNKTHTFIAEKEGNGSVRKKANFTAVIFQCSPQVHGAISNIPRNLYSLHQYTSSLGFDLLKKLRSILQKWHIEKKLSSIQTNYLMLIIAFPKTRSKGKAIEATDVWGFLLEADIKGIGIELGLWEDLNGVLGMLFPVDENKKGEAILLDMCRTMYSFSREMAAGQNGLTIINKNKICLIGVGSLGSQVFLNLIRAGFGEWTLIDNDLFLPHNLARHILDRNAIGYAKAQYLEWIANNMIDGEPIARAILKDVLKTDDYADDLKIALSQADVILDCSASSAVARLIARDLSSTARRMSLFFTPLGNDSVLLAEDSKREITLDHVEMQYYRLLVYEKDLEGHLSVPGIQLRYGNSCRDINTSLSQELAALHSAIGARAFRNIFLETSAKILIWRTNPADLSVKALAFSPGKLSEIKTLNWTICVDPWVVEKILAARISKLPNETGGILVGSFDLQRRVAYILDTVLSPPDSKEWPTVYIRGCQGLANRMKEIGDITMGRLEYMGEWHAHTGSCCSPSEEDKLAFSWLSNWRLLDGLPAVMLIAAEGKYAIYIEAMN